MSFPTKKFRTNKIDLSGRTILLTGVSRRIGIGFTIARHLLEAGAAVFIQSWTPHDAAWPWGADPAGMDSTLEELQKTGSAVEHLECDFNDPKAPRQLVRKALDCFGHLDGLICNHARSGDKTLEELTAEDIDSSMAVNLRASLLLAKEFSKQHDDSRPGGRIILFTSGQHLGPMPGELEYVASKGALHQLTASLSAHLTPRGITVNTVNPGATDTGWADEESYRIVREHNPQNRWGEPDDAARLVTWLCSDDSRWITGQVLNSNGGGY